MCSRTATGTPQCTASRAPDQQPPPSLFPNLSLSPTPPTQVHTFSHTPTLQENSEPSIGTPSNVTAIRCRPLSVGIKSYVVAPSPRERTVTSGRVGRAADKGGRIRIPNEKKPAHWLPKRSRAITQKEATRPLLPPRSPPPTAVQLGGCASAGATVIRSGERRTWQSRNVRASTYSPASCGATAQR